MNTTKQTTDVARRRHLTGELSTPLTLAATVTLAAGVLAGGLAYLSRSSVHERHDPATAAWWPHLVVGFVAAVVVIVARRRRLRSGRRGPLLFAPLSASAWLRLRNTFRTSTVRAVFATPLVALIAYNAGRAGAQILGGLDPNWTANAWGGPSYAGAMLCHYLDLALLTTVAAWALSHVLLPTDHRR